MEEERKKELQEKFARIYREHPHTDLETVDKVYETVKQMVRSRQDTTVVKIASECNLEKNVVARRLKLLGAKNYLTVRTNRTTPFLSVYSKTEFKKPIYGKENINREVDDNYQIVKGVLLSNPTLTGQLDKDLLSRFNGFATIEKRGTFFAVYNKLIDLLLEKGISNVLYMEIKSGANRYVL